MKIHKVLQDPKLSGVADIVVRYSATLLATFRTNDTVTQVYRANDKPFAVMIDEIGNYQVLMPAAGSEKAYAKHLYALEMFLGPVRPLLATEAK